MTASDDFNRNAFGRHREAAVAAVAIHSDITDLALDCFASLAMTVTPLSCKMLQGAASQRESAG